MWEGKENATCVCIYRIRHVDNHLQRVCAGSEGFVFTCEAAAAAADDDEDNWGDKVGRKDIYK